jgi:sugar O-acyltransferase (sialic acid O-acetyltransferase NeuD family)
MRVAIVGAGGHAQVVADILIQLHGEKLHLTFFDDRWEALPLSEIGELGGPVSAVPSPGAIDAVFVAIGDNRARRSIHIRLKESGHQFLTVIHPHTAISPQSILGEGTIAVAGVVANCRSSVGIGVILNTTSSVGHECTVGDFAQLAPGVNLGGASMIGEGVFLGIGAKVGPGVRIGEWSKVGAGAVVLDDLPERHFCAGIPARPIRPLRPDEMEGP